MPCSHLLHMPPLSSGQSKAKQHATQSAAEEVLQKLLLHVQANLPGTAAEHHAKLRPHKCTAAYEWTSQY